MTNSVDVAVVGAGIVGLANAWMAARAGRRVAVFERQPRAQGASIRNFGMIWPIGQPFGELHATAMRSRELWLEAAKSAGLWLDECGSLHFAYRNDELAVMEEFAELASQNGVAARMLTPKEVLAKTPAALSESLLGGLWSPTELCVNPRQAVPKITDWLSSHFGVAFRFDCPVMRAEAGRLETNEGTVCVTDRIVVCAGSDFAELFPDVFRDSGIKRCKLQMMRTGPQPGGWRIGTHLAGGLTLRHYSAFRECPSLPKLVARVADETPELDRWGIHVMASQNERGEAILGDSHEYDEDATPFDKVEIDELMERELRKLIRLPDFRIVERWSGVYAKHPTDPVVERSPLPGVEAMTATGGAGMTMSFGFAERAWRRWSE